MNVFVTGANGFIGSHLVDKLVENKYNVNVLVRKNSDLSNLSHLIKEKKINVIETNFDDVNLLSSQLIDVDYIYHVGGAVTAKNWEQYKKANVDNTINLLEATLISSPKIKRFLFVSSQTASGPSINFENPKTEIEEMNPISMYGKSKQIAEMEVAKYFDKIPITIARPPAVFGPRDKAILDVFKTVNSGIGAMIGFNKKYVSLINCFDLVDGFILAAESENSISQTYFISSDQFYTWDYLIPLIAQKLNKKNVLKIKLPHTLVLTLGKLSERVGGLFGVTPVFNKEKANDFIQNYWTCSIEKAKTEISYTQKIDIEKALELTIDWYKKNKWI